MYLSALGRSRAGTVLPWAGSLFIYLPVAFPSFEVAFDSDINFLAVGYSTPTGHNQFCFSFNQPVKYILPLRGPQHLTFKITMGSVTPAIQSPHNLWLETPMVYSRALSLAAGWYV